MYRENRQREDYDLERLRKIFDSDDSGLLEAVPKPQKTGADDRLRQSFLEVCEFFRANGREPSSESREILERRLGARLDGIRMNSQKAISLKDLDQFNLLSQNLPPVDLNAILEGAGNTDPFRLLDDVAGLLDTSTLPKISRKQEVKGEVAHRVKCQDFDQFEPFFAVKHDELDNGLSRLVPFRGVGTVKPGEFFVLGGLLVFVAEVGEIKYQKHKSRETRKRERLRLIFENGTESAMYRQSLAIRLTEGLGGLHVVPAEASFELEQDVATGRIYVLRSLSQDPKIAGINPLFKIGFTTKELSQRIANAINEPTYLMAPVEVVAEYRTYNLKASSLEHLLHRVFSEARLDIGQVGRDGKLFDSTEWFCVPISAIDEAIELITTGEIVDFVYDSSRAAIVRA